MYLLVTSCVRLPFVGLLVLFAACAGPTAQPDPRDTGAQVGDSFAANLATKGGLDGPVQVAPFFDGAFPSETPRTPQSANWMVVPAFPNLSLTQTLVIAPNPADDRIYVGSRDGLIVAFDNVPNVSVSATFLDLRDRVAAVWDGGLLALQFHPDFGVAGSPYRNTFYVYYSSHCPLDTTRNAPDLTACDEDYPTASTTGFFGTYLRLARFEVFEGTTVGDPDSEQVLLNLRLYNSSHRGGGIAFRDDGYLYLTIGDQFRFSTAQEIVDTLEGGTLRLAVDVVDIGNGSWTCPAGAHFPVRRFDTADEISGQQYCIPDDNPWLDPDGFAYEEYCAIGQRNPFRLAHDPVTDRLWSGEVGAQTREEINIIECGNNYGWPFREGLIEGVRPPPPPPILGTLTDPVIDFTRDEAAAIIGGYVYRGTRFPELYGRYLAGDYVSNRIWAITLDEPTMTATKTYLTNFPAGNLATWGTDNDGELFMGDVASTGPLFRLERDGDPGEDAPALLSEVGAFSNMATVAPSSRWVPYALNQPFWSDGALKSRFIAVPNDGSRDGPDEQVGFSETEDWTYPVGTVFMKHFELSLDESDPALTTRLETRFMVLGEDERWYGVTYRWREDQTDADLLNGAETQEFSIALEDGGSRTQTWLYPSRLQCMTCHSDQAGGALGASTHQLNGEFAYPSTGRSDNQLRTWNDLAMFTPALNDAEIDSLPKAPSLEDITAPLQDRARSWLDSNCGYCHRPAIANAGFDARFTTPFLEQNLLWTEVRNDLGRPGTVVVYPGDVDLSSLWQRSVAVDEVAMPPLAKELPEEPGVNLLAAWIQRLDPALPDGGLDNEPPTLENPGDQTREIDSEVALQLMAEDSDEDSLFYDAAGLPDGLTIDHDSGLVSGTVELEGSYRVTASASDGPEVSVIEFDWEVTSSTSPGPGPGPGPGADGGGCQAGTATSDGASWLLVMLGALLTLVVARRRRSVR